VAAREGFDAGDLRENYDLVALWSAAPVLAEHRRSLDRANPSSPLATFTASTTITPVIKSVSLLSPTSALVRFDTVRRDVGAATGEQRAWQATIDFRHVATPMATVDRHHNPLGFQVIAL
jgi:type IV secretion system protein VirB8